jgi:hypothetical protein
VARRYGIAKQELIPAFVAVQITDAPAPADQEQVR